MITFRKPKIVSETLRYSLTGESCRSILYVTTLFVTTVWVKEEPGSEAIMKKSP